MLYTNSCVADNPVVYKQHLINCLRSNNIPLASNMSLALYADDEVFYVWSDKIHQPFVYMGRHTGILDPWVKKWKMKVNTLKNETIRFTKHSKYLVQCKRICLQGGVLCWIKYTKYLGVVVNKTLTKGKSINNRILLGMATVREEQWS
ncbi:hypothetical protein J6590_066606 [Homalodisca vitripennis]|nr:hypothetical protein J6590_066606 [Homalodisca vitripennis]